MRERPILFNDAMVRAIFSGAKTQTRRPVKLGAEAMAYVNSFRSPITRDSRVMSWCPFGAAGGILWVRECWAEVDYNACDGMDRDDFVWCTKPGDIAPGGHPVIYRATCGGFEWDDRPESRWRPSIHMPRWASRLTLRVTDVRVERVQDITETDARAEGVTPVPFCRAGRGDGFEHVESFEETWHEVYGPESWTANPWVWVVSFDRVEVARV